MDKIEVVERWIRALDAKVEYDRLNVPPGFKVSWIDADGDPCWAVSPDGIVAALQMATESLRTAF